MAWRYVRPLGAMPFKPIIAGSRWHALVCDSCDAVMSRTGTIAPKRYRDSDPDDLAVHFTERFELDPVARENGWVADGERWSCPTCARVRS